MTKITRFIPENNNVVSVDIDGCFLQDTLSLTDFIGRNVTVVVRDYDDIMGKLLSINNGGYFIETDDEEE